MMLDATSVQLKWYLEKHPWAKSEIVQAREGIVSLAEEVIVNALKSDDEEVRMDAAKTVLRQLGRNHGWGENTNVIGVSVDTGEDKKTRIQAIFGTSPQEGSSDAAD